MPTHRLQGCKSRDIEVSKSRRASFGWANERIVDEKNDCDLLRFSGYWRCPADRWLGSSGRRRAATNIKLEWAEMEDYHHLAFKIYEEGKITQQF
jgi:hypothetical protein